MQITIYTVAYNEELMLPFFIKHYRTLFPECHIVVYDNQSTDRTVEIAKESNCEVIQYDTDNKISDRKYLEIKNTIKNIYETIQFNENDINKIIELLKGDVSDITAKEEKRIRNLATIGEPVISTQKIKTKLDFQMLGKKS